MRHFIRAAWLPLLVAAGCSGSSTTSTGGGTSNAGVSTTASAGSTSSSGGTGASVRIACGQTTDVVDAQGNTWSADADFDGGMAYLNAGQAVQGTATAALYDGQRYGPNGASFSYAFAVPPGSYTVTLKFTENFATAAGQRLFDVAINGQAVLTNFDIFGTAGGQWIAVDRSFTATVAGQSGLTIAFSAGSANNAKVDAISVLPAQATSSSVSSSSSSISSSGAAVSTSTSTSGATSGATGASSGGGGGGGLSVAVSGTNLVDGSGATLHLRGANVSGLEAFYTANSNPWGTSIGGEPDFSSLAAWQMNVIRLPLNEANWLRYTCNGGTQPDPSDNYQAALAQTVADANAAGLYVILDLHWSAPGSTLCPTGQGSFADSDHSTGFWASVAAAFKNNPAVMFEIFNEPFGDNQYGNWINGVDAELMLDGGTDSLFIQQDPDTGTFTSYNTTWTVAGFQDMVNAIRGAGATNVILVGCIGFDGQIETWTQFHPTDSLHPSQLAAAWHAYGWPSSTTTATEAFAEAQTILTAGFPLIITETNGLGQVGSQNAENLVFNWADSVGVSYLHWGWTPYSSSTDLTQTVSAGTPGAFVLTPGTYAVPTTAGTLYKAGLACAVPGGQGCW